MKHGGKLVLFLDVQIISLQKNNFYDSCSILKYHKILIFIIYIEKKNWPRIFCTKIIQIYTVKAKLWYYSKKSSLLLFKGKVEHYWNKLNVILKYFSLSLNWVFSWDICIAAQWQTLKFDFSIWNWYWNPVKFVFDLSLSLNLISVFDSFHEMWVRPTGDIL